MRLKIIAGGYYNGANLNTILEYDITGDSYTEIGSMTEARSSHAVSVVQYGSQFCQI